MPLAQIEIPKADHARIKAASALLGITLREFIVQAAILHAKHTLDKR